MQPEALPPAGTRLTISWPEFSTAAYIDHIKERNGTGDTILRFYIGRHRATASSDECVVQHRRTACVKPSLLHAVVFYNSLYLDVPVIAKQRWRQRIENGQISVNGAVVQDPDFELRKPVVLEYRRAPWREPPAPDFLDIIHIDDHLVAVSKPSGLQVLPAGPFQHRCVLTLLRQHFANALLPAPVHRLGRGTSGLLLCVRSPEARRQLTADFAAKTQQSGSDPQSADSATPRSGVNLKKLYLALVSGGPAAETGSVTVPIGRAAHSGLRSGLFIADPEHGKPARSHWRVLRRLPKENAAVLAVEILTGRPHQIRIHMAAIGHPLQGDPLYAPGGGVLSFATAGSDVEPATAAAMPGDCGYALHSWQMRLTHPVTGELLHLVAPPPKLFAEALAGLNWSWP